MTRPSTSKAFARLCTLKRLFGAATKFYADAFIAQPTLAADLQAGHRYSAARAAALAACGGGEDAPKLSAAEQTRCRQQAREWLKADLDAWTSKLASGPPTDRIKVQQTLTHWQADSGLAGLRDPNELAKLNEKEQGSCRYLWQEVSALLQKVTDANHK